MYFVKDSQKPHISHPAKTTALGVLPHNHEETDSYSSGLHILRR